MTSTYYLLGHRGARAQALENTQVSFEVAQGLQTSGLDGVEFDVQLTQDGEFVIVHDATLARLSQQQSWIADKTLAELSKIKQSEMTRFQMTVDPRFLCQPILPLAAVLPLLQGYQHIELEIKTHIKTQPHVLVNNLLRLLSDKSWQALPITLTSFDTDILYQLQNQQSVLPPHQRYPTGLLLEPNAPLASQTAFLPTPDVHGEALMYQTFNHACALGCGQVGVYYALITPTLIKIAKRFGLKVTAWTVNEPDIARRLISQGVDCVITDYPSLTLKQLVW